MKKMVVCRLEDALIEDNEAILMETMLEIDRIKNNYLFSIITANDFKYVIDYNRDFPFIDCVFAFNGNYVFDVLKNKCVYDRFIDKNIVNKILSGNNWRIFGYTLNGLFECKNCIDVDVYRLDIFCKSINKTYKELLDMNLNVDILTCKDSRGRFIRVINKVDITGIINKLQSDSKDVIFIGGNLDDRSIIENYGGFIVKNSPTILKKIDGIKVSKCNRSRGVCDILKKLEN